jgi:L-ascorbate metabolism protein UlaG (beta-lactamase superfamily)
MKLKWFGHAAFEIDIKGRKIYIDPFSLPVDFNVADLILITHEHYDHCDLENIKKIQSKKTLIVTTETAARRVPGKVKVIKEGNDYEFDDNITISAVPAYNPNKPFHPRGFGVGFILESGDKKIYHAGDTDLIPEMETFGELDVALLPVGGTYTMNVEEAVKAVKIIKPKIAIPMHYGKIVGDKSDADKFKKKVEGLNLGIKVKIFEEGEILEI